MPFDPSEEAEEGAYDNEQAEDEEAYDEEQDDEEAESEGGSSVGFEVLVDRGDKRLGFQCIASSSSEYHITSVTIGKDQPVSYEVMRLDEAGYEKFLHYLDALGIDDTFVNVVNYCVQVHDDQSTTPPSPLSSLSLSLPSPSLSLVSFVFLSLVGVLWM